MTKDLAGKLIVMVSWKHDNMDSEVRRKVYLDPDDYHQLRQQVSCGVPGEDVAKAKERGVYLATDVFSTKVTTLRALGKITSLQIVGHVEL